MSDPRMAMRPPQGAPQGGAPQGAPGQGLAAQRSRESIFNPVDMASKVSRGDVRPDMTVREFFSGMGIDVDGPISQLGQKMMGQAQNAGPMSRMRAAGAQGGAPGMQRPQMPQGGAGGGGLSDLMAQIGGGGR